MAIADFERLFEKSLKSADLARIVNKYAFAYARNADEYAMHVFESLGLIEAYRIQGTTNGECAKHVIEHLAGGTPFYAREDVARDEAFIDFLTNPFVPEEGLFTCGRCSSTRTISFQRQTRSADEGATTFVQCTQCGNQWKNRT